MGTRFGEGRGQEPGSEVGEDGVAGGVEGVCVSRGRVTDRSDEKGTDEHWMVKDRDGW